jgi:cysteinyl-tRNA synthetase
MTVATLGSRIDVLAGGADLAFPHHAYQDAMVAAVSGVPLARARLAVATVGVDGAKMAKSTGNLVLVADLLQDYPAEALRLLLVDRSWQAQWDYAAAELDSAVGRLDRLRVAAGRTGDSGAADEAVTDALLDDLDVPAALDLAEEQGGSTARRVLQVLALD